MSPDDVTRLRTILISDLGKIERRAQELREEIKKVDEHLETLHQSSKVEGCPACPSWKLEGFDTFEGSTYPFPGEWETEAEAQKAAQEELEKLEVSQPTKSSGGQGDLGIQDRIYIIRPGGSKYRYTRATRNKDRIE